MISRLPLSALALPGLLAFTPLHAAVTLPSWHGEPNTTSQVFLFDSGDPTPFPNISNNPYGTASAVVDAGFFGNGWENPANLPLSNPGHDGDGAWDIGTGGGSDGSISIHLPVAPFPPPPGYRLDILIHVIAFEDLQKLPLLSVSGLSEDPVLTESDVLSTRLPNGRWHALTWEAAIGDPDTDSIIVTLAPPFSSEAPNAVSVIDRVEIHTRLVAVPEPSLSLLALVSGLALGLHRRRV